MGMQHMKSQANFLQNFSFNNIVTYFPYGTFLADGTAA